MNDLMEIGWSPAGVILSLLVPDTAMVVRSIDRSMNLISNRKNLVSVSNETETHVRPQTAKPLL
jgi:hypothetical protein